MGKKIRKIITEKEMRKEYIDNKNSTEIIAKKYKVSPSSVIRMMKYLNIPIRSPSERQLISIDVYGPSRLGAKLSEESRDKIRKKAIGRKHSEKAKKKMSNSRKGELHSKEHNMKVSMALKGRKRSKEHCENIKKSKEHILGKTYEQIFGEERAKEMKKNFSIKRKGSGNSMWRGGISFEPYDKNFNNKFKNNIRRRDNQICILCNIHREKLKRALDVHHIDYNKLLSVKENCLCLCNSCHTKTNSNRKHWTKFFQSLLNEKYGYEYSESNEIVINIDEKVEL